MNSLALFWIGFKWFIFGLLIGSLAVWWFKDWIRSQAMAVWLWIRSKITRTPPALLLLVLVLANAGPLFASSATANVGQTVTMTVTADGTQPFAYQWKRAGVNIPGATSASYVITSVQLSDLADYTCQVTNQWGTTLSDVASLTVKGLPPTNGKTSFTITNTVAGVQATVSASATGINVSVAPTPKTP